MPSPRTVFLAAVAGLALLGAGTAFAQSDSSTETRVIQVPKGAVVLVLPPGTLVPPAAMPGPVFGLGFPFVQMPDTAALVRQQMDQMTSRMQHLFTDPAFTGPHQVVQVGGDVNSIVVTSFSNGHGTCTRIVTSTGDVAAPKVEVRTTGDAAACDTAHVAPTSSPGVRNPHVIQD